MKQQEVQAVQRQVEDLQGLSEKIEDLYKELKRLNDRMERIEKILLDETRKEQPVEKNIENQISQLQKTLSDLSKTQREMVIQLRTVYDILGKARLEKKGIFF